MSHFERAPRFSGDMATTSKEVSSTKFGDVEQIFHAVAKYEKLKMLTNLVQENGNKRILVFVKTNRNADFVAIMLCQQKMWTSSIHGDRVRRDRKLAREDFNNGNPNILVATSAAICGRDMTNVDIVVNYDLPKTMDEYASRIGLTGCDGRRGVAVSFFDVDQDASFAASLAKTLRLADQPSPDNISPRQRHSGASQVDDKAAVTSEISTPLLLQSPESWNSTNDGGHQLLMTPRGPMVHWACTCSECSS